ncbi:MAG: N-acetyltransferase [Actinobacteria bacterium]|nr:N-acetyltransferase [Actinomycetota bacterium]
MSETGATSPPGVFVHPRGLCESDEVGEGTRVWAFAHVAPGAVVGIGCNLCDHVYVEQGAVIGDRVTLKNGVAVWDLVTIGDDVFVGPFAVFTNDPVPRVAFKDPGRFEPTRVERGATIGANATIVCGNVIGEGAFVGAGSTVLHDVPAYSLVVGAPASHAGWICACGERLDDTTLECSCGRRYRVRDDGARPGGLVLLTAG